ncbi:hypothetical protein FSZ31_10650 [Sphingorhabdus soli]|uniref:Lipoprotein n=1 Tax=Flavisphingopyxis soli TaxID=2601267 RepID=A0A5C6U7S8_9SPHN|nr:hypothetical protein [Sphingorhabdus soli]TXC68151.1 hypothetical protein FSZ31_10650 [Sphingorhabdus soli]
MRMTATRHYCAALTMAGALAACGTVPPQDADANAQTVARVATPDDRAATASDDAPKPANQQAIDSPAKTPAERAAEAARKAGREPPPVMMTDPHPEPVPQ